MGRRSNGEVIDHLLTPLGGMSEIVAVSQRAINGAMKRLLVDHPETGHVQCHTKRGDSLDALIDEPKVALSVTGDSRDHLFDEKRVKELGRRLVETQRAANKFNYVPPVQYDVSGWVIAFSANIGTEDVEKDSDEEKKVRQALKQVEQADILKMDKENSHLVGVEFDDDDWSALGGVLNNWYLGDDSPMKDRKTRTIGYALRTNDPRSVNSDAPTFPPTSLKFQTYEYKAPGHESEPGKDGIGVGDNNVLLYLITDNEDIPNIIGLPWNGNLVEDGKEGTVCVATKLIWDDYLLRKTSPLLLHSLNQAIYARIKSTDQSNSLNLKFDIGIGSFGRSNDFYYWEPVHTWADMANPVQWTWAPNEPEQTDDHGVDHTGNDANHLTINCKVSNSMTAEPGSNMITMWGDTNIRVQGRGLSEIMVAAWSFEYDIEATVSWVIAATMTAVENGGIQTVLDLPSNPTDVFSITTKVNKNRFDIQGVDRDEATQAQLDNLVNPLKNQLSKIKLGEVAQALQNNLNGAARFVVPGGGAFSYADPMFNYHGDLMVDVKYRLEE
ncbi:hypothetical protein BDW72DRAFT_198384 [Aspergillus terricola var. indicus]